MRNEGWKVRQTSLRLLAIAAGENFQRHVAAELGVTRTIHLAHSARAQQRENLVWSYFGARGQWHGTWSLNMKHSRKVRKLRVMNPQLAALDGA